MEIIKYFVEIFKNLRIFYISGYNLKVIVIFFCFIIVRINMEIKEDYCLGLWFKGIVFFGSEERKVVVVVVGYIIFIETI